MKKGKTKTIMLSVLIILAAGLLVFSLAARTTRDKPESDGSGYATNASALEVSDGGDIFTAPAGLNAGSSGVPEEIGEYGRLCAGDYDTIVPDGSYTNKSFGYICSPSMAYVQIRHETQGWDSYWHTDRMMFSASNNDGWYYFRGYNPTPKGDYSYESRICLDTIKPQVQVFVNGKSAADGSRTNSAGAVISVSGSDDLSGIESYWYKINNGPYCQCDSGAAFTAEGEYAFYVKDRAGNVSDAVTVTKDATAPALSAYDGSVKIGDRAHTNASSIRFEASDELSGASAIYIFRPDSSILLGLTEIYSLYVSLPVTLSALEGEYKYYAKDKAGNKSATYSFTVDRTYPTAQIYSGTAAVPNNY
ncbi:MAG: hypothetical protein LBC13_04290, partial [Clostridiales bacterium]|nr:hypothetical protein [Clostridiales bacterium]